MKSHTEHDTKEHLLATGAQLCLSRGFTGMGLSELLATAKVPKGSFYHYFRSKEAFGVAMLERHYLLYNQQLQDHFNHGEGPSRERLIAWYQQSLSYYYDQNSLVNCLTVKLSAEVCDLSEDMRHALDKGAAQVIAHLCTALEQSRTAQNLHFKGEAQAQAQMMYALWLGASLQAKISCSATPLECALSHITEFLAAPRS